MEIAQNRESSATVSIKKLKTKLTKTSRTLIKNGLAARMPDQVTQYIPQESYITNDNFYIL